MKKAQQDFFGFDVCRGLTNDWDRTRSHLKEHLACLITMKFPVLPILST